jgi:periplasmic divalent cation tolerance protein
VARRGRTGPGLPRRHVDDHAFSTVHRFYTRASRNPGTVHPIRTIYRWQGQVHDKTEGRVALRTRRSLLPQIIERTKRDHPFEVPSVVAVPIIDGGPDYLRWILDETA